MNGGDAQNLENYNQRKGLIQEQEVSSEVTGECGREGGDVSWKTYNDKILELSTLL